MGFLTAIFVVSNMQSMELPDEYRLEKLLVDGDISVEEYLAESEVLEHSPRLKELRTAIYENDNDNLYTMLVANLKVRLRDAWQMLSELNKNNAMDEDNRLRETNAILDIFREVINDMHKLLQKMIFREEARLPR